MVICCAQKMRIVVSLPESSVRCHLRDLDPFSTTAKRLASAQQTWIFK